MCAIRAGRAKNHENRTSIGRVGAPRPGQCGHWGARASVGVPPLFSLSFHPLTLIINRLDLVRSAVVFVHVPCCARVWPRAGRRARGSAIALHTFLAAPDLTMCTS